MRQRLLTVPEALAAALCATLAGTIALAYFWGTYGTLSPTVAFGIAVASAVVIVTTLARGASADPPALVASAAVLVAVWSWLLSLAWPSLLPPGRGPDLTHHLMLVDFLERNWRLPDASLVPVMVEMAHYTPGVHVLAALAGAWTRSDGFHAIYTVLAFTVALKCVFVFLIAARLLESHAARVPLALAAVVLCLLPTEYSAGAFVHDSFLAQVAAELFAIGMVWAVVLWDARPAPLPAVLFGVVGAGAFLTWPMWIGPPVVTAIAVVATRDGLVSRARLKHLAIALTPIALVALVHTMGRVGWLAIAGTTGIVLEPSVETFGWPFVVTAAAGLVLAFVRRESRVPLLLTISIAVQAVTLFFVARARGAPVPYMAFKMAYLIVYPLAVLGALAPARLFDRGPGWLRRPRPVGWALPTLAAGVLAATLLNFTKPVPVVSSDLYDAGRWARRHVASACVDYLVPDHETMHWLHLAVLGNSRTSLRTIDPSTFDPDQALIRWIEPSGLPYAIAHVPALPNDVLDNVDVLERFGTAAVVRRRGPSSCADAQRLADAGSPTR
jgi:hypothetical protein